jgi:hypothetical protein
MLKENDVAQISEQFGLTKDIVEASANDGTLGQRIKDAIKDQVVYKDQAEFEKFKTNHGTDVTNKYFADLVEKAKKGDIPQDLYAPIKGAALQQFERETAKKHGVETYENVNDLIDQLVKKSANGKGNEDLERKIDELKKTNLNLAKEKDEAITTVTNEYKAKFLSKEKDEAINLVPHDFSNVKPDELESRKLSTQKTLKNVFDADYKLDYDENNMPVVLKDGEIIRNDLTHDPVPVLDVMIETAKAIGQQLTSPDTGGQGGSSSGSSNAAFHDADSFYKHCASIKINPTSPEGLKLLADSGVKLE